MKKTLFISLFTVLSLSLFAFLASNTTFAQEYQMKAKGTHQKTTGEFVATVGSTSLRMIIAAHDTDIVKGNVQYSNSSNGYFTGEVDICYNQDGNSSAFVGTVTDGNYGETLKYFKVWTYDGGEGEMADETDKVRVVLYTKPQDCSLTTSYPATVVEGNIQVHTN